MQNWLTIKQASKQSGLPEKLLRKWSQMEIAKSAYHRLSKGPTSPFYIDMEILQRLIRDGKLDC